MKSQSALTTHSDKKYIFYKLKVFLKCLKGFG